MTGVCTAVTVETKMATDYLHICPALALLSTLLQAALSTLRSYTIAL
jgi:hypothetical protein